LLAVSLRLSPHAPAGAAARRLPAAARARLLAASLRVTLAAHGEDREE
jgi:hypothetical protein